MSGTGYRRGIEDRAQNRPPADLRNAPWVVRQNYLKGYGKK